MLRRDPTRYAESVRERAREAGVDPRLLMSVLLNESYKPHLPVLERLWQRFKPGAAFGVANMHREPFEECKRGRGFADRRWRELPDDPDLAIRAAAWHLTDLAADLPTDGGGGLTATELVALGYNTGARNMAAFARGVAPGPQAADYLARFRANWPRAVDALDRAAQSS